MQEVQTILPVGTIVRNRYIIEDLLGRGGFGAVYLVRDQRVKGNLFALKEVIDPSRRDRERFVFEGDVLRRLEHRALPRVYYAFEDGKQGRAYILMDYIDGPNLETLRQQQPGKRFPLPQVIAVMAPIMDAISFLHSQHPPIIHRDIKPSNIIVPNGSPDSVLVDFGIAKEYDPDSTTTAIRRCSPGYGAPEQYSLGTDTRTDIYGLGATIYALLTGVVPADALHRMTQLGSRGTDPLEPIQSLVPDIPPPVAEAIHRAMAINSSERFATVEQFWQVLNSSSPWQQGVIPVLIPETSPPPVPAMSQPPSSAASTASMQTQRRSALIQTRKRNALPFILLLLFLLMGVALTLGLWAYSNNHAPTASSPPTGVVQHTSTRLPQPTVGPSPTQAAASPTAAPTTSPQSQYPVLARAYNGTIHNTPAGVDSTMSLSSVAQSGQNIRGYLTLGPDLQGNGPFTGTVDTSNHIRFTVPGVYGHAPLYFTGTIHADGSMSGDYCSLDSSGKCNPNSGGYGTWRVAPVTPGSGSSAWFKRYPAAHRNGGNH